MKDRDKTLLAAIMIASVVGVQAATVFYGTVSDEWSEVGNWDNGIPGTTTETHISGDLVWAAADGDHTRNSWFDVGREDDGSLTITGGSITLEATAPESTIGLWKHGTLTIAGGTFNQLKGLRLAQGGGSADVVVTAGTLNVGLIKLQSSGKITISGGTTLATSLTADGGVLDFPAGSTGSLTITGANQAYYEGLYASGDLTYITKLPPR